MLQLSSEDAPVLLCPNMTLPQTTTTLYLSALMLSVPSFDVFPFSFTQDYIIISSTLPDCFKRTPTGSACLTMAGLHTLPKTRIAFTPTAPAEYGCHLTVSFYNEWEQNAVVKGNWGQRTDDFGPRLCVRWRRTRCVSLWLVSYVAQAESTAVYRSWSRGKMQSWPYSTRQNHIKHTHTHTGRAAGCIHTRAPQTKPLIIPTETYTRCN